MARVKASNPIRTRIFLILFIIIVVCAIAFLSYMVLKESMSSDAYDLGKASDVKGVQDEILTDYNSYKKLMDKYDLTPKLTKDDFKNHSYLASYQDYDKCSEYKYKSVKDVEIKKAINVTFLVYNKCGMCQRHMLLYLIELPKDVDAEVVDYKYEFYSEKDCGNI